ncbi:Alpha/Beta hydrolase protein, partial [Dimargaris cristalligena]
YLVTKLPHTAFNATDLAQYAGVIPVTESGEGGIFFWLMYNTTLIPDIRAPHNPHKKLVVWFNGGPGCTSLDGVFLENGPYQFTGTPDNIQIVPRDWSFTQQAVMLYVDQPLGTGFSYAPEEEYSTHYADLTYRVFRFLTGFYALFPELDPFDIYLAGESQAGVYIPYIAQDMLRRSDAKVDGHTFALKGLMIGNGWLDPLPQYRAVLDMARAQNLHPPAAEAAIQSHLDTCVSDYSHSPPRIISHQCEAYINEFIKLAAPEPGKCYNNFDYRKVDTYPECGMNWPPQIHTFTAYFRLPAVWKALHVDGRTWSDWSECNNAVGTRLENSPDRPSIEILPNLLTRLPVLLVHGDKDLLCNYMGAEKMISQLTWGGQQGFMQGGLQTWQIDSADVGLYQSERNLIYARLFDASHMAGVDKPLPMFDLLVRLTGTDVSTL